MNKAISHSYVIYPRLHSSNTPLRNQSTASTCNDQATAKIQQYLFLPARVSLQINVPVFFALCLQS